MQPNSDVLDKVEFLTGNVNDALALPEQPALAPFSDDILDFLNEVSKVLMRDARSKAYSDVITFAFWIRKASLLKLKERFSYCEGFLLGKGVVFHIAPSNVPVNFAYSLVSGLICGNANVVRVPSKAFPQVNIITEALTVALEKHEFLRPYVLCVRYDRNKEINDYFSAICDMRVVWGGDQTIAELRKSTIPPRSGEVTFADRYSIAVINSNAYLAIENKNKVVEDFYNDTFFSDQNACTSPRLIVWTGTKTTEAKDVFWESVHEYTEKKYTFQSIQGVNKLTKSYLIGARLPGCKIEPKNDNLVVRVSIPEVPNYLMDYRDNCGYFYEYECKDIMDIKPIVNDKRCQTVAYIGDRDCFDPLLKTGIKGIDRIVPVGKTMDFDLIWDGYNLPALLTRTIVLT